MISRSGGPDDRSVSIPPGRSEAVEVGVDRRGVIVSVSESCQDLLGWRSEDLVGTPLTRMIPQRFHEAHRAGFNRFLQTRDLSLDGQTVRLPAVHAVVGEIEVELRLRHAEPGQDAVVVGTLLPRGDEPRSQQSELTRVVQQAVSADLPLTELLHNCLAVAASQHGWATAAVWWIDPWLDRLRVIAIWEAEPGSYPNYLEQSSAAVIRRGEGIVGSVWSTGVATFHTDLAGESSLVRDLSMVRDGLQRGLFFPLTGC